MLKVHKVIIESFKHTLDSFNFNAYCDI